MQHFKLHSNQLSLFHNQIIGQVSFFNYYFSFHKFCCGISLSFFLENEGSQQGRTQEKQSIRRKCITVRQLQDTHINDLHVSTLLSQQQLYSQGIRTKHQQKMKDMNFWQRNNICKHKLLLAFQLVHKFQNLKASISSPGVHVMIVENGKMQFSDYCHGSWQKKITTEAMSWLNSLLRYYFRCFI